MWMSVQKLITQNQKHVDKTVEKLLIKYDTCG